MRLWFVRLYFQNRRKPCKRNCAILIFFLFVAHFLGWAQNSQRLIFCALFCFFGLLTKIFLDKFWFQKKWWCYFFFFFGFDFSGSIDKDWERGVGRNFTNIFFKITDNISKKRIFFATTIYTKTITTNINKRGIN